MIRRWLLALFLGATLASCGGGDFLPADFVAARDAWRASKIADYHYSLARTCLCPSLHGPPVVVVRGGKVVSARYEDGTDADAADLKRMPSIDDLYGLMKDAYAHDLTVRFAAGPGGDLQMVYIDYIKEAADDELWLSIYRFAPDPS